MHSLSVLSLHESRVYRMYPLMPLLFSACMLTTAASIIIIILVSKCCHYYHHDYCCCEVTDLSSMSLILLTLLVLTATVTNIHVVQGCDLPIEGGGRHFDQRGQSDCIIYRRNV